MTTPKTGFEIRGEMLQLAKDYLDQQYHMNVTLTEKMIEQGRLQMDDLQKAYSMYTTDELMAKAKEFYSFVSKKD